MTTSYTLPNATVCGTCAAWVCVGGVYSPVLVTRSSPSKGRGSLTLHWGEESCLIQGACDSFYGVAPHGDLVAVAYSQGGAVWLALVTFDEPPIPRVLSWARVEDGTHPAVSWLAGDGWQSAVIVYATPAGVATVVIPVELGDDATVTLTPPAAGSSSPDFPAIAAAPNGGLQAWREKDSRGAYFIRYICGADGYPKDGTISKLYDPSVALGEGGRLYLAGHAAGRTVQVGEVTSRGFGATLSLPSAQFPHLSYGGGVLALAVAEYVGEDDPADPDANRVAQRYVLRPGATGWAKEGSPGYITTHGGVTVSPDGQIFWTWVDEAGDVPIVRGEVGQ